MESQRPKTAVKDRQSMLCIGGPLDGERFAADKRDGFVVPVIDPTSHPLRKLDSPDALADSVVTVINTRYRAEPFHTPQGSVAFWVPYEQTPLETITKLIEHYRPKWRDRFGEEVGFSTQMGDEPPKPK